MSLGVGRGVRDAQSLDPRPNQVAGVGVSCVVAALTLNNVLLVNQRIEVLQEGYCVSAVGSENIWRLSGS